MGVLCLNFLGDNFFFIVDNRLNTSHADDYDITMSFTAEASNSSKNISDDALD